MRDATERRASPTRDSGPGVRGWRIGADIGGTFTDLVLVDDRGRFRGAAKVLTTEDPSAGVIEGVRRLLRDGKVPGSAIVEVIHGTTLVANTLIERRGAPTALITTAGFRDVLEIMREARYDLYDLDLEVPQPLVPRQWRLEVPERVLANGEVARELDREAVAEAGRRLAADGVQSVAILFLHSYRHPQHEEIAAETLSERVPELDVSTSASVLAEMGEIGRLSTTVANAYVRPLIRQYLQSLGEEIGALCPGSSLSLIAGTGRVAPAATLGDVPIRLLESGPAGGVLAATRAADRAGIRDCLAFDMGGTTAKASYVIDGHPRLASSFEVARVRRFARGSGLPIQLPSIEMIEIGAGGGSIAWVDGLGLLRVGPESAGSHPGPASYRQGGTNPTVTDADLVLGHLRPNAFLGGTMALDTDLAEQALAKLGSGLQLSTTMDVARAVREVVDEQMAAALRRHAVEQGLDRSRFTLVATGGAGPMHACSIARILGIRTVLIPARAGVASAHGFLGSPLGFDVARSAPELLGDLDWDAVGMLLKELEDEAMRAAGKANVRRTVEADLRFRGQGGVITVPVEEEIIQHGDTDRLRGVLHRDYRSRYQRVPEGVPEEILTWRVAVAGPHPPLEPMVSVSSDVSREDHPVYFSEIGDRIRTPVVAREAASGIGPMLIEERESTLVVPPSARVETTGDGSILIELVEAA